MAAFNTGNRLPTVPAAKATLYAVGAISTASIAANVVSVKTITLPFQFKGNGPLSATLPEGITIDAGLSLGGITLEAPATGSYAAGNHPTAKLSVINNTTAAITPAAAIDVIIVQR